MWCCSIIMYWLEKIDKKWDKIFTTEETKHLCWMHEKSNIIIWNENDGSNLNFEIVWFKKKKTKKLLAKKNNQSMEWTFMVLKIGKMFCVFLSAWMIMWAPYLTKLVVCTKRREPLLNLLRIWHLVRAHLTKKNNNKSFAWMY